MTVTLSPAGPPGRPERPTPSGPSGGRWPVGRRRGDVALLAPHGLCKLESLKSLRPADPKPGAVVAQTHAYFESVAAAQRAVVQTAAQLMADVPNYTNIRPDSAMFEVLAHG